MTDSMTPEQALADARAAVLDAVCEHDLFNRHDPEGCNVMKGDCPTILPALDALIEAAQRVAREAPRR